MKKLLVVAAFIGLAPIANAEAYATITHVKTNYENVRVNVPKRQCR